MSGLRRASGEGAGQGASGVGRSETTEEALLSRCQREIELAWNNARDVSVVERLTAAHPELEDELNEFFADVIEAEDDYDRPRPEYAEMARKARAMVRRSGGGASDAARPRTFLRLLMDAKGESVEAIARSMEVPLDFLIDVSDHGRVLPMEARRELVRRARIATDVAEAEAVGSFDVVSTKKAASRDRAYQPSMLTYESLVKRSGLSAEEKGFWMSLF